MFHTPYRKERSERKVDASVGLLLPYQPRVPGAPLKGPVRSLVIQPP